MFKEKDSFVVGSCKGVKYKTFKFTKVMTSVKTHVNIIMDSS